MKNINKMSFVALCLIASGCTTTLVSNPVVTSSQGSQAILPGVIYSLPVTGFEVSAKFRITSCVSKGGIYELDYDVLTPDLVQRFISDPGETYVIDYQQLNDAMKTTTANFTLYPNGMLKSLNAQIDDRTSQVLASIGGAAVNLAKAVGVGGFIPFSAPEAGGCPAIVNKKIASFDILTAELRKATDADKELESKQQALVKAKALAEQADATLAAAPKESSAAELAKLKAAAAAAKKAVERLTAELKGKEPQAAEAQKKLQKVTRQLTADSRGFWIPGKDQKFCTTLSVNAQDAARGLFDPGEVSEKDLQSFVDNVNAKSALRASFCVEDRFEKLVSTSADPRPIGLVYRIPATGLIEIRKQKSGGPRDSNPISYSENILSLPQFGAKAVLPLRNTMFDKNQLKASFQEDGALSTLDFITESKMERAAASLQELTKLYGDYLTSLQQSKLKLEQDTDAATARERARNIADIDAKIAEIKKLQDLEVARSGLPDRLDLQKSVTTKQRELVEEQIKLDKAKREREAQRNQ